MFKTRLFCITGLAPFLGGMILALVFTSAEPAKAAAGCSIKDHPCPNGESVSCATPDRVTTAACSFDGSKAICTWTNPGNAGGTYYGTVEAPCG